MRKILSLLALATMLLSTAGVCRAAEASKTLAVVSFAGYDKLVADFAMIGRLAGNPDLGKQLEMMALVLPQGEGSQGPLALDAKKPWGLVVLDDKPLPGSYAFLPVSDIKPLINLIQAQSGKEVKQEGGVYEIPASGKTLFASHKGGWAFVADSKDQLNQAAADPASLLGDLPERYVLAARVSVKNLPEQYRQQLLAMIRAGTEVGMQQMPSENASDYAMRLDAAKQMVQQWTTLAHDLDDLVLGWNIDSKTNTTYIDLELTAQTGTKLAYQFAEIKPGKTRLGDLAPAGAAVTFGSVGTIGDLQVSQAQNALASLRETIGKELEKKNLSADDLQAATRTFGELIDVLQKNVESRKTDTAMALTLEPKAMSILAGAAVVEGAKMEKALAQMLEAAGKSDEASGWKIAAETHQGFALHSVAMPTPSEDLEPLVGETLEVAVGLSDDLALAAVGHDAVESLKKAIDRCKAAKEVEVPPLKISISVLATAKFLAEAGDDLETKSNAAMVAGLLTPAGEKDHVVITASPIRQGLRLRIEAEDGLLKAVGSLSRMLTPGGGMPGAQP